jgi:hypothetical protein
MMILPLAGALISFSALISGVEDIVRYRNGTFKVAAGEASG